MASTVPYSPASQGSAVSLTLEWAHDDLALAGLADDVARRQAAGWLAALPA